MGKWLNRLLRTWKRDAVRLGSAPVLLGVLAAASIAAEPPPPGGADQPIENSLGMKFARVAGVRGRISIWETRVRDYQVFAEETRRAVTKPDFAQTADDPAVNVSWEDALAFCNWLTERERKAGRLTGGQRYRLPTDSEWSLAAGVGTEQGKTPEDRLKSAMVWPWGCVWPPRPGDGNYAPELETDKFESTSPVGSFKANANGLFDVGGNVWEWCEDWYNDARVTKALRGGSFHDSQPRDLLTVYRFSGTMHLSNDDIGFRVLLEDSPPAGR